MMSETMKNENLSSKTAIYTMYGTMLNAFWLFFQKVYINF